MADELKHLAALADKAGPYLPEVLVSAICVAAVGVADSIPEGSAQSAWLIIALLGLFWGVMSIAVKSYGGRRNNLPVWFLIH